MVGLMGSFMRQKLATISFEASEIKATNATVFTHTAMALGTASGDRQIVVAIDALNVAALRTILSVTVAGVTATELVFASVNQGLRYTHAAIYIATVPAGATGDVVITWSGSQERASCATYAVYGALSTADDTNTSTADPMVATLDIPANGVAVGVAHGESTPTAFVWTNLTEDYDEFVEATSYHTGASDAFATQQSALSITCDPNVAAATRIMALASLGPR